MKETRQTQIHHTNYNPPETIIIFKGEHYILTLLSRMKKPPSEAFVCHVDSWCFEKQNNPNSHIITREEMLKIRRQQDAKRIIKRRKGRQKRLNGLRNKK